jgi:DinB family protein
MSPTDMLIGELERTRDETLGYFSLGDADLSRTYGPGKWSVRFLLHHLTDSEVVFTERLRRVISEPSMIVWYYDQDAWAKALDYSTRPLTASRPVYETLRGAIITDARRHYEGDGAIEFVHSKSGLRTLKEEFDKVAAHNEHHLRHIRTALGGVAL